MEYLRGRIDGQKIKSHEGQFLVIGKENTKPSWLGFKILRLTDAGAMRTANNRLLAIDGFGRP
jgi:hypothetical protein